MQCNKDGRCGDSVIIYCALLCTAPIFMSFLVLLLSISIWCVSIFWVSIVPSVTQACIQNTGGFSFLPKSDWLLHNNLFWATFQYFSTILLLLCYSCHNISTAGCQNALKAAFTGMSAAHSSVVFFFFLSILLLCLVHNDLFSRWGWAEGIAVNCFVGNYFPMLWYLCKMSVSSMSGLLFLLSSLMSWVTPPVLLHLRLSFCLFSLCFSVSVWGCFCYIMLKNSP